MTEPTIEVEIERLHRRIELKAIRAFVERVDNRADQISMNDNTQELYSEHFLKAFQEELAALYAALNAMEAEVKNAGTHD